MTLSFLCSRPCHRV